MRKILLVIDMQNDFIDGSLGTSEARSIIPAVQAKTASYPDSNIIATRDTHDKDYLNTSEGKNLPVEHCTKGTHGWEIHPEIAAVLGNARIIDKPTFGSVALVHMLQKEISSEPAELELIGLCTDICVVSNALLLKAAFPEVQITVDAACCAGVTPETHRAALATMKMCQIRIIGDNTEQNQTTL